MVGKTIARVAGVLFVFIAGVPAMAQGPSDWALNEIARAPAFNSFVSLVAEQVDGRGGQVDIAVDGNSGGMCPGGREIIRFIWQFAGDNNHIADGGSLSASLQAGIVTLNPPCNGAIAALSSIALNGSSGVTWPLPERASEMDFDRVYTSAPASGNYAWAGRDPRSAVTAVAFGTRPAVPNRNKAYYWIQIGLRGSGEARYVYIHERASASTDQTTSGISLVPNVDLYGGDYSNFDLGQPNPELCRNACASDGRCRAFTYVQPGVQGPQARCWLKSTVPQARTSNCCVSGAKN